MIKEWFQSIFRANAVWMEQEAVNDAVLRCFLADPSHEYDYDQIEVTHNSSNQNEFIEEARNTMEATMPIFMETAIYMKNHKEESVAELAANCKVIPAYVEAIKEITERLLAEDEDEFEDF